MESINLTNCKFKIKSGEQVLPELTLEQLILTLKMTSGSTLSEKLISIRDNSTKFSVSSTEVVNKLKQVNQKEKAEISINGNEVGGEYTIKDPNRITPLQCIEELYQELGSNIPFEASDEEYIQWYIKTQIEPGTKTEEEIIKEVTEIRDSWKRSCADGMALHNWMPFGISAGLAIDEDADAFVNSLKKFKLENGETLYDRFAMPMKDLYAKIAKLNYYLHRMCKDVRKDSEPMLRNIHLSTSIRPELKERLGADKVGIHVDNIQIDKYGHYHIFNYKFGLTPFASWAKVKLQKYDLEMGAIKEIFEQNGFNSEGSSYFNIPIQIVYNKEGKIVDLLLKDESGNENYGINYNVQDGVSSPVIKAQQKLQDDLFNAMIEQKVNNIPMLQLQGRLQAEDEFLRQIIPEYDAAAKGLNISAKAYISQNINVTILKPENGIGWDIIDPDGNTHHIESNEEYYKNQELLQYVTDNLKKLNQELPVVTQQIVKSIRNSYELGYANFEGFGFKAAQRFLNENLGVYFRTHEVKGEVIHEYTPLLNDELNELGIFLFQNNETNEIDVVCLSSLKLDEMIPNKHSQSNLLAHYCMNLEDATDLKSCYGHMEMMRAASVLNSICDLVPNMKLGKISAYSPYFRGSGMTYSASYIIQEFSKIQKFINNKLGTSYKNNFSNTKIADSYDIVLSLIESIANNKGFDLPGMKSADDYEAKYQHIKRVMQMLEHEIFHTANPELIERYRNHDSPKMRTLYQVYHHCALWMLNYNGVRAVSVEHVNELLRNVLPQYANPDENVRFFNNAYANAANRAANDFVHRWAEIKPDIEKYESDAGVTIIDTKIIGSTEHVYDKFYKKDPATGANTFMFVNPYSDDESAIAGLTTEDRTFLKKILFQFAKVRAENNPDLHFDFTGINDPRLMEFIKKPSNHYFLVPLIKATNIRHTYQTMTAKVNKVAKQCSNVDGIVTVLKNSLHSKGSKSVMGSDDFVSIYDLDGDPLMSTKTLLLSENDQARARLLKNHDASYFETNIGNILAEYLTQQCYYNRMRDVELLGKALLFEMYMTGEHMGERAKRLLNDSAKYLQEQMMVNLYQKSIMSKFGQSVQQVMRPFKQIINTMYLAANLRSMFRDSFEGLWQNTVRTLSHYHNDLSSKEVAEGYGEVLKHIFTSDRSLNIMSELCLKYRLSNCDTAKIAERAKTGKGGIMNPMYMSFGTLRGPDFLNRMTLFVSRCIHDGCWDAFDIKDNRLVYDPKKDKRFYAYFHGTPGTEEYHQAQSRYFSAVIAYNKENPDRKIKVGEDLLPEPYNNQDIASFKVFADEIYGAYDRSQRARYEQISLGQNLGIFTTWMNGIAATWFKKQGKYNGYFTTQTIDGKPMIRQSQAGNDLYFRDDGGIVEKIGDKYYNEKGEEEANDGKCPVVEQVPIPVQGIMYTFKDVWDVFKEDGFSKESFLNNIWRYRTNRDNLNKALADMLMMGLFALIFGCALTPWYEDKKKMKDTDDVVASGITELLYNSSHQSFDGFFGPWNIISYCVNDLEPTVATTNIKIVKDVWKTVMGKKTFNDFIFSNAPVVRIFKQTIKNNNPDLFKVEKKEEA